MEDEAELCDLKIPVVKRKATDRFYLLLLLIFLITWLGLVSHCIINGDIRRVLNGYDSCGNICGIKNKPIPGYLCSGQDHTNQTIEFMDIYRDDNGSVYKRRLCLTCCPTGYLHVANHCFKVGDVRKNNGFGELLLALKEIPQDIRLCWREVLYMSFIGLALSTFVLLLFRSSGHRVVWFIIITSVVINFAGMTYLWIIFATETDAGIPNTNKWTTYLILSMVETAISVLILVLAVVMKKRVMFVGRLLREAAKIIQSMPQILLQPAATLCSIVILGVVCFYFFYCIESAGQFVGGEYDMHLKQNDLIQFTRWYNLFAFFWFLQFFTGCQHMIIAGAVSNWYFLRDKSQNRGPIWKNWNRLLHFHLGSVAIGSLLIALVQFFKAVISYIQPKLSGVQMFKCCLGCVEMITKYLTRNAYIEVVMYGKCFVMAGKRAFNMLSKNLMDVLMLASVGGYVLTFAKWLVTLCTGLAGLGMIRDKEGVENMWLPLVLGCLITYLVINCFMSVYEMTIDTVFLCYCEDLEMNDGSEERPYYMSQDFKELMENSRKKNKSSTPSSPDKDSSKKASTARPSFDEPGAKPPKPFEDV